MRPHDDMDLLGAETFELGPLRGLAIPSPDLPYVSLAVDLYQGSVDDPPEKEGTARLCGQMLMRGTERHGRAELAEALDGLGASLDVSVRKGVTTLHGDVAAEYLDRFLELLAEVLWRPSFPEEELEKLRRQTLSEITSIRDDDAALARMALTRTLYADHPWGRPTLGFAETVAKIDRNDLLAFYRAHYAAGVMLFGVSGATTSAEIRDRLARHFPSTLPNPPAERLAIPAPRPLPGRVVVLVDKPDRTQSQVLLGHATVAASHPDMVPLAIGNTAFGGTFTARLMQEIRVKRGWSYGAYSRVSVGRELSAFQVAFYPKTHDTVPALELVLEMLEKLQSEGLSKAEVDFARNYNLNAFPFSLETHPKRLHVLLATRYLDRPADWLLRRDQRLARVTEERVREAFARHLDPERLVIAITCTADEIEDALRSVPDVVEIWRQPHDQPWSPRRIFAANPGT